MATWPIDTVTLHDGRTVFCRGRLDGLPVFAGWGRPGGVPAGFATRRQLRAADLAPGGHGPAAILMFGHRQPFRRIELCHLYRVDLAVPKRTATPAQRAAIDRALLARRTCPTCPEGQRVKPYYLPRSEKRCWDCLFPTAPAASPAVLATLQKGRPAMGSTTFRHGDRVRHRAWSAESGKDVTGTVYVFPDAEPGTVAAEIRWDGSVVADELALVAPQLELI